MVFLTNLETYQLFYNSVSCNSVHKGILYFCHNLTGCTTVHPPPEPLTTTPFTLMFDFFIVWSQTLLLRGHAMRLVKQHGPRLLYLHWFIHDMTDLQLFSSKILKITCHFQSILQNVVIAISYGMPKIYSQSWANIWQLSFGRS
jgi:hypothetical protein